MSFSVAALQSWTQRPVQSQGLRLRRAVSMRGQAAVEAEGAPAAEVDEPEVSKNLETMRKFSEQYAKRTDTYFCTDKSVTAVVIQGLAEKKDKLGAPLCPCRHYDDEQAEANQGFWNCPCVPMRERKECHCMLFLTPDNDFSGDSQEITIEEVKDVAR